MYRLPRTISLQRHYRRPLEVNWVFLDDLGRRHARQDILDRYIIRGEFLEAMPGNFNLAARRQILDLSK